MPSHIILILDKKKSTLDDVWLPFFSKIFSQNSRHSLVTSNYQENRCRFQCSIFFMFYVDIFERFMFSLISFLKIPYFKKDFVQVNKLNPLFPLFDPIFISHSNYQLLVVKFGYSEKATKFDKIFHLKFDTTQ